MFKKPLLLLISALMLSCSNSIELGGIMDEVEVLRDNYGINHIYANNQNDLFFMQGYLAAKDRLFQFEIWRRQATGTVSEIFGEDELERDIGTRLFKFRGDMKDELNHYHEDGFEIVSSFVSGVNKYIEEVNANPENMELRFKLANSYLSNNETEKGFSELLKLFEQNPTWNEEAAKKKLLEFFDLLGFNDPNVLEARKKLSSIMFK